MALSLSYHAAQHLLRKLNGSFERLSLADFRAKLAIQRLANRESARRQAFCFFDFNLEAEALRKSRTREVRRIRGKNSARHVDRCVVESRDRCKIVARLMQAISSQKSPAFLTPLSFAEYLSTFWPRHVQNRTAARDLLQNLCPIAFLAVFFCLCSCDANFLGPDSRELAGGYRLKRVGDSNQFALTLPDQGGGLIVDEIGWHKPFIIARSSGSDYWEAINTARAHRVSISDLERKADPVYQSIQIEAAEIAWTKLNRRKRIW